MQEKIIYHKSGKITHLIVLKSFGDDNFVNGVVGLEQFQKYVQTGKFSSVKHVNLDSCQLKNIPESIFNLSSLETLSLDNNNIKDIPDSISNLKSLKMLYLDGNKLEKLPNSIGLLHSLRFMSIRYNQLKNIPKNIIKHGSFSLQINNNRLKKIPSYLEPFIV